MKFLFERWGGLRPEWKMQPNGKYFMPLFFGVWIEIPKPAKALRPIHCEHGYNGLCPTCDAMQTPIK